MQLLHGPEGRLALNIFVHPTWVRSPLFSAPLCPAGSTLCRQCPLAALDLVHEGLGGARLCGRTGLECIPFLPLLRVEVAHIAVHLQSPQPGEARLQLPNFVIDGLSLREFLWGANFVWDHLGFASSPLGWRPRASCFHKPSFGEVTPPAPINVNVFRSTKFQNLFTARALMRPWVGRVRENALRLANSKT